MAKGNAEFGLLAGSSARCEGLPTGLGQEGAVPRRCLFQSIVLHLHCTKLPLQFSLQSQHTLSERFPAPPAKACCYCCKAWVSAEQRPTLACDWRAQERQGQASEKGRTICSPTRVMPRFFCGT